MGSNRGKFAFRYKGKYFDAYNHSDSCHEGKGADIVKEIQCMDRRRWVELWKSLLELILAAADQHKKLVQQRQDGNDWISMLKEVSLFRDAPPPQPEISQEDDGPLLTQLPDGPYKEAWIKEGFTVRHTPPQCNWEIANIYLIDLDDNLFLASYHHSIRFSYWPLDDIPVDWIEQAEKRATKHIFGPIPMSALRSVDEDVEKAGFKIIEPLALSRESIVYRVKEKHSEMPLVLKVFYGWRFEEYNLRDRLKRNFGRKEIQVAETLLAHPHRNLVEIKEVKKLGDIDNQYDAVVMYMAEGVMKDFQWVKSSPDLWEIVQQVAHGLAHLHSVGYLHYDTHPRNILYSLDAKGNHQFALCDFEGAVQRNRYSHSKRAAYYKPVKYTRRNLPEGWKTMDAEALDFYMLGKSLQLICQTVADWSRDLQRQDQSRPSHADHYLEWDSKFEAIIDVFLNGTLESADRLEKLQAWVEREKPEKTKW